MAEIISIDTGRAYHPVAMCQPTEAQRNCVRYAYSDGECSIHEGGCRDCPATLYDEQLDQKIVEAGRLTSIWELLGWASVIWIIIAAAGAYGLTHQARQVVISERV